MKLLVLPLFEKIYEQHKIKYYKEMKELHGDLESL